MSVMSPATEKATINGIEYVLGAYTVGNLEGFCEWCRQSRARDLLGVKGIDPDEATTKQRLEVLNEVPAVMFGDAVSQSYWNTPTGMARFVWCCIKSTNKGTFSQFSKAIGQDVGGLGDAMVLAFRLASPVEGEEAAQANA
jgi:hypothetical protein